MRFAKPRRGLVLGECRIGQDHRGFDLAVWDRPVGLQQFGLAIGSNQLEAISEVETDRPVGGGPGADQHPPCGQAAQVKEERTAHPAPLRAGSDVRMADEIDIANGLDAHDADQDSARLIAPKLDSGGDLFLKLVRIHVWIVPSVRRDHAAIGLRGGVHDVKDGGALVSTAAPYAADHANLYAVRQLRRVVRSERDVSLEITSLETEFGLR